MRDWEHANRKLELEVHPQLEARPSRVDGGPMPASQLLFQVLEPSPAAPQVCPDRKLAAGVIIGARMAT